jgi:S-adenosylmethionine hydrolase
VVEHDWHYFMAPDNGLLAQMLDAAPDAHVFKLDLCCFERLGLEEPSATFHGRDIFAPIAADLASGRTTPVSIGIPTKEWIPGWIDEPDVSAGKVAGVIVTVDTFGNLISPMLTTYGRARPGDYLALINSFDVVEIAKAEDNAAEGLGSERGAPIVITDGALI